MLPHLNLAHVSLIYPLISLSSQYFSISIPSFLFFYSLQNFDLSILFQSCCISWYVLILIPLFICSSNSSLFPFFIVSHIPPSPTSSIAIPFSHCVGFWVEISLISSLKQIFGYLSSSMSIALTYRAALFHSSIPIPFSKCSLVYLSWFPLPF